MTTLLLWLVFFLFSATGTAVRREYLTLRQTLERYPWMSERWLRRKVAEKRLPYAKADGKLLFTAEDIDQFVERTRVEPEP
jgi:phage terminase large subunit